MEKMDWKTTLKPIVSHKYGPPSFTSTILCNKKSFVLFRLVVSIQLSSKNKTPKSYQREQGNGHLVGGGIGVGGLNKIEWHKVADSFSCIIGKKSKHLYYIFPKCLPLRQRNWETHTSSRLSLLSSSDFLSQLLHAECCCLLLSPPIFTLVGENLGQKNTMEEDGWVSEGNDEEEDPEEERMGIENGSLSTNNKSFISTTSPFRLSSFPRVPPYYRCPAKD